MKKILFLLGLILTTCLGVFAQNSCSYVFHMYDSYGDGWNGGSAISVKQGNTVVGSITMSTGYSAIDSITLTAGNTYTLVWSEGSGYTYDEECSFDVYFNGLLIYTCSDASQLGTAPFFSFIGCSNCFPPMPYVTTADQYSVNLSWNSNGQNLWEYAYGAPGFNPNDASVTPLNTTDTFVTISGLTASSSYDFYIRSICDPLTSETSNWRLFSIATTQDNPGTIPYSTGFETSDDNNWVLANGNNPNKWAIGTATHNTGSRALYISDNNGNSYGYDTYVESNVWAYRDIDLGNTGNPHSLSFDWKCEGFAYPDYNEFYDYMEVYIGAPVNPVNGAPSNALYLGRFVDEPSWQQANILLSENLTGIQRLYFHWINTDESYYDNSPAAVDNISIVELTCGSIDSVTATNPTTSSLTLTPYTPNNATDFVLYYKKASDTEYDTVEYVTASPSYVLDNLASGTYYNIIMRIDCGNGDLGYASPEITVMTSCNVITAESLPFNEGFEGYHAANLNFPPCWGHINTYTSGTYDYPYITYSYHYSGERALYLYSTGSYYNAAVLPEIDANLNVNSLTLSFMIRGYNHYSGAAWRAIVGVMDSANDINTFVPVDTVSATSYSDWNSVDVSFTNYTGSGKFIAILNKVSDTTYNNNVFFIDDVTLYETSDCQRPTSVTASNILSDSATIHWTPQGSENAWLVAVVPAGGNPDTVTAIPCTADSLLLGGLLPYTTYEVYVKADCGTETSIWTSPYTFTTACGAYNIPFLEEFSNDVIPPTDCWSQASGILDTVSNLTFGQSYWYTSTSEMIAGNGSHIYNNIWGSSRKDWLISPSIDLGDGTTPYQVEMDVLLTAYGSTGAPDLDGSDDKFAIVVSTDNGQTWSSNNAFIWDNDSTTNSFGTYNNLATLTHVEIPLRNGSAQNFTGLVKIAIYAESTTSNADNNLHVDNFAVNLLSNCPRPTHLTLNNISSNEITASWSASGSESSWNVAIFPSDSTYSDDLLITNLTDTFYTFNNLSTNTDYTIYVQSDCGSEQSAFVQVNCKTLCDAIDSLPYFEGFENCAYGANAYPDCWFKNTSIGSSIYVGNSNAPSGNRTLYFYTSYGSGGMAIMPKFEETIYPLNTLQVTFNLKSSSLANQLVVGYITNPTDESLFVGLDTVSCSISNTVESFDVTFTNVPVTNGHIAFKTIANPNDYVYFYLDDIIVDLAPDCVRPSNLHVASSTTSSINLAWTAGGSETEWEVVYGTVGFDPDNATPISVYTTPATSISNLSDTTSYEFYVRAVCNTSDFSNWRGPVAAMPGIYNMPATGTHTISMCGGHIYDNGGPNNDYSTNCNTTLTVMPDTTGMIVQLQGTYDLESGYDYLRIYDGTDIQGTLLFESSSSSDNGVVPLLESTSGPLTIYFESDYLICSSGFELAVNCVPAPTCVKPFDFAVANNTSTDITLSWTERGTATMWDIEYGNSGFTQGTGTMVSASTNPFTINNLTTGTSYDFYVRSNCGSGDESDWVGPITGVPGAYIMPTYGEFTVTMCGGVIYDDGGLNNDYSSDCDALLVVNPDSIGQLVHLTGTFNVEEDYDRLVIFDGNTSDGTVLFDSDVDNTIDVVSTTGPLTIYFMSDYSTEYSGFAIQVNCENGSTPETCEAPTSLTFSDLTHNSVKIDWAQQGAPDSWVVSYKKASANTWSTVNTTTHPYVITNLEPQTQYEVFVTAMCGTETSGESNHITFTTNPDGVNSYEWDTFSLYPNPTTGQFTIYHEDLNMERVEIYDVYGKRIQSMEVNSNIAEVDASPLASGVYFVRITCSVGSVTKSFVKK